MVRYLYLIIFLHSIEVWLLIDICDVKEECDLGSIKENKRVSNKKKYTDAQLTKIIGGYDKSNIKFEELFMDKIDIAIKIEN